MDFPILFEDQDLFVIDKPPGVVVDRSERTKGGAGIVHRLDKETSGCLLVAKTPHALIDLQKQFRERTVKKEYLALVHGALEPRSGTVRVPIARSLANRQKFTVSPNGRIAETHYAVVRQVVHHGEKMTLVRLFPKTGRTHQIRVHMEYFGHPLVSDSTYGGKKRSGEDRVWCPRIFLHAQKISFIHPVKHSVVTVDSPLPNDLRLVLSDLS